MEGLHEKVRSWFVHPRIRRVSIGLAGNGATFVCYRVRRHEGRHDDVLCHKDRMDEPARVVLRQYKKSRWNHNELGLRDGTAAWSPKSRMDTHHDEAGRRSHCQWNGGQKWKQSRQRAKCNDGCDRTKARCGIQ